MIVVLTTVSVVAMYSNNTSSVLGGTKVGREFRYYLSSTNAAVA
jgi:hypothetical protein